MSEEIEPQAVVLDPIAWLQKGQMSEVLFGTTTPEALANLLGPPRSLDHTVTDFWIAAYGESEFAFRPDRTLWDAKLISTPVFMAIPGRCSTLAPQYELTLGDSGVVRFGAHSLKDFDRLTCAIASDVFAADLFQTRAEPAERHIVFHAQAGDRQLDITYRLTSRPVDDGLFDIDYFLASIRISDYALIRC